MSFRLKTLVLALLLDVMLCLSCVKNVKTQDFYVYIGHAGFKRKAIVSALEFVQMVGL